MRYTSIHRPEFRHRPGFINRFTLAATALAILLAACTPAPAPRPVSLYRIEPAPAGSAAATPTTPVLRIAAAPVVSPQETARSYRVFFDYLGRQLGRPVEMIQQRTYRETYDLLRQGTVDLALVCTYVYVKGRAELGLELVAAPEYGGKSEYYSLIIARPESGIETFADLAGKDFAFTDPLSNSGRMYPLALVRQMGQDPRTFFLSTTYTYSHDASIRAVLRGVVDGAAVDSLVFDQMVARNPGIKERLKIIGRSQAFATPPFVTRSDLDPETKRQLQQALVTMHLDPEGKDLLKALGIDRFVPISDAAYESVRETARQAGEAP